MYNKPLAKGFVLGGTSFSPASDPSGVCKLPGLNVSIAARRKVASHNRDLAGICEENIPESRGMLSPRFKQNFHRRVSLAQMITVCMPEGLLACLPACLRAYGPACLRACVHTNHI